MNEMYMRIEELCKQRGVNITQMCRDADIPRGNLTDLKMDRTSELSTKTLAKISTYFHVSMDYLLGNVSDPFFYLDNERIKAEINSYEDGSEQGKAPTPKGERAVSDDDIKFALFGGDGEITDAMFDEVKNFAAFVKAREQEKKKE